MRVHILFVLQIELLILIVFNFAFRATRRNEREKKGAQVHQKTASLGRTTSARNSKKQPVFFVGCWQSGGLIGKQKFSTSKVNSQQGQINNVKMRARDSIETEFSL